MTRWRRYIWWYIYITRIWLQQKHEMDEIILAVKQFKLLSFQPKTKSGEKGLTLRVLLSDFGLHCFSLRWLTRTHFRKHTSLFSDDYFLKFPRWSRTRASTLLIFCISQCVVYLCLLTVRQFVNNVTITLLSVIHVRVFLISRHLTKSDSCHHLPGQGII